MFAYIMKADGEVGEIQPKDKKKFTLDELQTLVGGLIEFTPQPIKGEDMVLLVNEEGLLKGLEVNMEASNIAGRLVVGDAVYCNQELVE